MNYESFHLKPIDPHTYFDLDLPQIRYFLRIKNGELTRVP